MFDGTYRQLFSFIHIPNNEWTSDEICDAFNAAQIEDKDTDTLFELKSDALQAIGKTNCWLAGPALLRLASTYNYGKRRDKEKAERLYKLGFEKTLSFCNENSGYYYTRYELGECYALGLGTEKDILKAIEHLSFSQEGSNHWGAWLLLEMLIENSAPEKKLLEQVRFLLEKQDLYRTDVDKLKKRITNPDKWLEVFKSSPTRYYASRLYVDISTKAQNWDAVELACKNFLNLDAAKKELGDENSYWGPSYYLTVLALLEHKRFLSGDRPLLEFYEYDFARIIAFWFHIAFNTYHSLDSLFLPEDKCRSINDEDHVWNLGIPFLDSECVKIISENELPIDIETYKSLISQFLNQKYETVTCHGCIPIDTIRALHAAFDKFQKHSSDEYATVVHDTAINESIYLEYSNSDKYAFPPFSPTRIQFFLDRAKKDGLPDFSNDFTFTCTDNERLIYSLGYAYGIPEILKDVAKELYYGSKNNKQDLNSAFHLFRKCAEKGQAECAMYTGFCYRWGCGVQQNIAKASYWLSISASKGDPDARRHLAEIYTNTFKDPYSAFELIQTNYTEGYSKLDYAKARLNGTGCVQNKDEAVEILRGLAKDGNEEADKILKSLAPKPAAPVFTAPQKTKERWICLDTETTGLSKSVDRICEIGAVEIDPDTFRQIATYHVYINPEKSMPFSAFAIHGLSDEFLADKPKFRDVVGGLLKFIQGAHVYIHNAPYDVGMLNAELFRCGLQSMYSYCNQITCTLALARRIRGPKNNRLDDLCDAYKIDRSDRTNHGALLDSILLAQVLPKLLQQN